MLLPGPHGSFTSANLVFVLFLDHQQVFRQNQGERPADCYQVRELESKLHLHHSVSDSK